MSSRQAVHSNAKPIILDYAISITSVVSNMNVFLITFPAVKEVITNLQQSLLTLLVSLEDAPRTEAVPVRICDMCIDHEIKSTLMLSACRTRPGPIPHLGT